MFKKINFEFILGLLILVLCISIFIYYSSKLSFLNKSNSFALKSDFFDIGNLQVGSDVKINGVIVGEVGEILLNSENYMAIVETSYFNHYEIPLDSTFKIAENGFLGSPYIEIILGSSSDILSNNEFTLNNIDAISLEEIINSFIFK